MQLIQNIFISAQKRKLELIEKYNDLKKSGKLRKHLIKENKKRRKPLI